jgi:arylsulfatase A-like enzyme
VGKWHVGHSSWEQTPTFRGFDSFFGFYQGGQDYFTHKSAGGVDLHKDVSPNCGKGCSQIADETGNYSTHVFTREAIQVVENHARRFGSGSNNSKDDTAPLFLYLAYQAVHCPDEVPPEYKVPYQNRTDWTNQRKTYAGMLTAADEGIGNLTSVLKDTGLWDNTLVVLTTDNGGPTTVGCTQGSSNYPKRGGKCSLWEGGTTGDALLAGPALPSLLSVSGSKETTRGPSRFQHLFHVVDWFPTLAEWVGVVPANQTALDGISQAEALRGSSGGGEPARTELFGGYAFWRESNEKESPHSWWGPSLRHLNWKIIQGTSGGPDAKTPMPSGTNDIVPPGESESGGYLLFDLERDPEETTDLSAAYPEILESMVYRLKLYRSSFAYPQENDDAQCPWPGLFNSTTVGPAWCVVWFVRCNGLFGVVFVCVCLSCAATWWISLSHTHK